MSSWCKVQELLTVTARLVLVKKNMNVDRMLSANCTCAATLKRDLMQRTTQFPRTSRFLEPEATAYT